MISQFTYIALLSGDRFRFILAQTMDHAIVPRLFLGEFPRSPAPDSFEGGHHQ